MPEGPADNPNLDMVTTVSEYMGGVTTFKCGE